MVEGRGKTSGENQRNKQKCTSRTVRSSDFPDLLLRAKVSPALPCLSASSLMSLHCPIKRPVAFKGRPLFQGCSLFDDGGS